MTAPTRVGARSRDGRSIEHLCCLLVGTVQPNCIRIVSGRASPFGDRWARKERAVMQPKPIAARIFAWGARIALWPARRRARRAPRFAQLAAMNARELADIGLTAQDLRDAMALALDEIRRRSRRARRRGQNPRVGTPAGRAVGPAKGARPRTCEDRVVTSQRREETLGLLLGFARRRDFRRDAADDAAGGGEPQPAIPHRRPRGDRRALGDPRPGARRPGAAVAGLCRR